MTTRLLALPFVGLVASTAAHADCGPVLAAYAKAEATRRYAVYEVDSIGAKPKEGPIVVVIGDAQYAQHYVSKSPLDYVMDGYRKGPHDPNAEIDKLKDRLAKGAARCDALGAKTAGGVDATGFLIRNNEKGDDIAAIALWIDRGTGLPVMHSLGVSKDGFGWVYGNAVAPPPNVR